MHVYALHSGSKIMILMTRVHQRRAEALKEKMEIIERRKVPTTGPAVHIVETVLTCLSYRINS